MSRHGQNSTMHHPCIRPNISVSSNTCSVVGVHTPLTSKGEKPDKEYENQRNEYHVYQNYDYDPPPDKSVITEEQTPLQRPRPPEHHRIGHDPHDYDEVTPSPELPRRTSSFNNRNQCLAAVEQNGFRNTSCSTATPTPPSPAPRRNKRENGGNTPQSSGWSSRLSERLSSVIINPFMYVNDTSNFSSDRTRNGYKYETCAINSDDNNMNKLQNLPMHERNKARKSYTCRQMCYAVIIPSIILSLIVISLCSLLVYFYMIQVSTIDNELKTLRVKRSMCNSSTV